MPLTPSRPRATPRIGSAANGFSDIATMHHCLMALKKAGFDILEEKDLVNDQYGGWQNPVTGEYSAS